MKNKILKYTAVLLCAVLVSILQKFDFIVLCFVVIFIFFSIFFYLQYKKYGEKSYYIYNIHIDYLPVLSDFFKIKKIDIRKIKSQYFDNYCEKEEIFYKKNIWEIGCITHIEISIYPIRFYQNILLTIETRNERFIQTINQLHLEPTPLWLFYNQNTKQKYHNVQEFIESPPARFNNWYQYNFKTFWDSLNQKEKENYCIKYNAPKEWQKLMCGNQNQFVFMR